MTNREYINNLSNKDFIKFLDLKFKDEAKIYQCSLCKLKNKEKTPCFCVPFNDQDCPKEFKHFNNIELRYLDGERITFKDKFKLTQIEKEGSENKRKLQEIYKDNCCKICVHRDICKFVNKKEWCNDFDKGKINEKI